LCNEGCIPKYYGDKCELSCPEHCKGGVCDRQMASCLLGCKQGYRGVFCNESIYTFFMNRILYSSST
jgi:hypothetical protein